MELVTVRIHRALKTTSSSSSSSDRKKWTWQGEHVLTHRKVTVCPRTDRRPLSSMSEQGCQICQIHLDTLGGNINTQKKTAFDLMVGVAMGYTSDNTKKDELLQRRDDKVEALGLGRPKGGRNAKRLVAASDGADLPTAVASVAASDGGADLPVARVLKKKTSAGSQEEASSCCNQKEACSCCCSCSGCSVYWMICMSTAEARVTLHETASLQLQAKLSNNIAALAC